MNAYIFINGKRTHFYESYGMNSTEAVRPLPRSDEIIYWEKQNPEFDKKKGYKIDCLNLSVIRIIHNLKEHEIQIRCDVIEHEVRYHKP